MSLYFPSDTAWDRLNSTPPHRRVSSSMNSPLHNYILKHFTRKHLFLKLVLIRHLSSAVIEQAEIPAKFFGPFFVNGSEFLVSHTFPWQGPGHRKGKRGHLVKYCIVGVVSRCWVESVVLKVIYS